MDRSITELRRLLRERFPRCEVAVDAPDHAGGNWMLDLRDGKKRHTLEYRPGKGFGLFRPGTEYGEGPAEIYRTPERAARRLEQLLAAGNRKDRRLDFRGIRELYGHSQVELARKVGVKQSAICRFERRDEVKLSTLAAAVRALGGKLEVRARFADSDVPIAVPRGKA